MFHPTFVSVIEEGPGINQVQRNNFHRIVLSNRHGISSTLADTFLCVNRWLSNSPNGLYEENAEEVPESVCQLRPCRNKDRAAERDEIDA